MGSGSWESVTGADVAAWPYSVSLPCRLVEIMVLFEQWAGHRLLSEKRLLGRTFVLIALFLFLLFLCRKELKYSKDVASLAA